MKIKTKKPHSEIDKIPGFFSGYTDNHMDLPPSDPESENNYKEDHYHIGFWWSRFKLDIKFLFQQSSVILFLIALKRTIIDFFKNRIHRKRVKKMIKIMKKSATRKRT